MAIIKVCKNMLTLCVSMMVPRRVNTILEYMKQLLSYMIGGMMRTSNKSRMSDILFGSPMVTMVLLDTSSRNEKGGYKIIRPTLIPSSSGTAYSDRMGKLWFVVLSRISKLELDSVSLAAEPFIDPNFSSFARGES